MDDNPYRSPEAPIMAEAIGVLSGKREDLRRIAKYQRCVMLSILTYIIAVIAAQLLAEQVRIVPAIIGLVAAIVGLVFAVMLSSKVYDSAITVVLLAVLMLVPCLGLIGLLVVNQKATNVLKRNGIKVGFLGADPNTI
jgi:hypothetical protein